MRDGTTPVWARRAVLAGAAATLIPGRALSQDSAEDERLRLVANLFTRVAGLTRLNGRGPFRFVIDTGAASTAVSDRVASALALPPAPLSRVHGIASAEIRPSATIDALSLGGRRFHDLRCPILPDHQLGADGLIGLDVLARFRLTFDVGRGSATLSHRDGGVHTRGAHDIGSRLPRGGLRSQRAPFGQLVFTQVEVADRPCAAFIDSGAQYSIGNLSLREALGESDPGAPITLFGVTGQSIQAQAATVRDIRLGGDRLGATPLLFADLHCFGPMGLANQPALLIGTDMLGRFREVTLDFRRGTVGFSGLRRPIRERSLQVVARS